MNGSALASCTGPARSMNCFRRHVERMEGRVLELTAQESYKIMLRMELNENETENEVREMIDWIHKLG